MTMEKTIIIKKKEWTEQSIPDQGLQAEKGQRKKEIHNGRSVIRGKESGMRCGWRGKQETEYTEP